MGVTAVCFHAKRRCSFCRFPQRAKPRTRLRCPCCGRFVARAPKVVDLVQTHRCRRCREHGYFALQLFAA